MCNFGVRSRFLDVIYGVRPPNGSPGLPLENYLPDRTNHYGKCPMVRRPLGNTVKHMVGVCLEVVLSGCGGLGCLYRPNLKVYISLSDRLTLNSI